MGTYVDYKMKQFEAWLFVETYMIAFIVVANCIFLCLRNLDRGRIVIIIKSKNSNIHSTDDNYDYFGDESTATLLNIF